MEYKLNEKNLQKSASKIEEVYNKYLKDMNVYYGIIPDKNYYLTDDHLKLNYEKVEEVMKKYLKDLKYIEISDCLDLSDYYRTDLHWKQENLSKVVNRLQTELQLENFNLQEFANNSFGIYQGEIMEVVLKFNKKIKDDVINYHFHPTQKMEIKKDFVIVSFRASGDEAICWELFKWGDNVQIIKPKKLKEIYKNKLLSVLKKIK